MTTATHTRRSSIYVMTLKMDKDDDLSTSEFIDWMVATCWKPTAGSMPTEDGLLFAFRAEDDETAIDVANYLAVSRQYKVFTGIGVHRREVAAA